MEAVWYSGGCSVQCEDNISTVEAVQYNGGITSVQWRLCGTVEGFISIAEDNMLWCLVADENKLNIRLEVASTSKLLN